MRSLRRKMVLLAYACRRPKAAYHRLWRISGNRCVYFIYMTIASFVHDSFSNFYPHCSLVLLCFNCDLVYEIPCGHCKNVLPYDGREDCIFNTTGRYMYSYEVMNQAEGDFIRRALPIQLAYQSLCERIRSQWYVLLRFVVLCSYFEVFLQPVPIF